MDFLWSNHFPCLESLDFTSAGPLEDHPDDEQMFFEAYSSQTRPKLIFANPPPQLRSIKINGVMNVHIFGSISRHHFSGLSDIDISFAGFHPDINQIYSLLEANPCLASLCFNSEQVDPGLDDRATVGVRSRPRLTLSSLVSLSFVHIVNPDWNISVLKTFMAPALQHLKLSYWDGSDSSQLLADYISNQGTDSSPYFPITLNRLSFFTIMGDTPNPECLLRAYPNITVLHTGSLAPLLKRPWLLPNLRCLSVATQDAVEFKNVVLERCRDGLPLENVELRWFGDKPLPSEDEEQIGKIVNLTVSIILLHEVESRNPDDDGEEQP
ncbi:hypothetical protein RSOLAG1IB_09078 [Rhizoctonia solani AG-1 IB]|uniref:Uncharacterized protein n=1 Tax=Thanatephorus cucumeris (strain AG1-IB / isolate 7/3/14) TaxID=1108050 RepID=A0A0B7FMD8_THACB|nr:hypothetical protein RSOLAG1IB_09078 [Rhizoctonia solani AG-1 IB]